MQGSKFGGYWYAETPWEGMRMPATLHSQPSTLSPQPWTLGPDPQTLQTHALNACRFRRRVQVLGGYWFAETPWEGMRMPAAAGTCTH